MHKKPPKLTPIQPKPLEEHIASLAPLIATAHIEATRYDEQQAIARKNSSNPATTYPALTLAASRQAKISTIYTLAKYLDVLEQERTSW